MHTFTCSWAEFAPLTFLFRRSSSGTSCFQMLSVLHIQAMVQASQTDLRKNILDENNEQTNMYGSATEMQDIGVLNTILKSGHMSGLTCNTFKTLFRPWWRSQSWNMSFPCLHIYWYVHSYTRMRGVCETLMLPNTLAATQSRLQSHHLNKPFELRVSLVKNSPRYEVSISYGLKVVARSNKSFMIQTESEIGRPKTGCPWISFWGHYMQL